jgi:hypothetical protein
MTVPKRLYAGDLLAFGLDSSDYPPADGWTLKLRLTPRFTTPEQTPIELTATANGTVDGTAYDYVVEALPVATAAYKAGQYGWACWVEKSGARKVLEGTQYAGEIVVLPDPATITAGTDTRSQARKALDDALAAYAAWTPTFRRHTIGDRSVEYSSKDEIRAAIRFWQDRVNAEEGRGGGPLSRMRFGVPN